MKKQQTVLTTTGSGHRDLDHLYSTCARHTGILVPRLICFYLYFKTIKWVFTLFLLWCPLLHFHHLTCWLQTMCVMSLQEVFLLSLLWVTAASDGTPRCVEVASQPAGDTLQPIISTNGTCWVQRQSREATDLPYPGLRKTHFDISKKVDNPRRADFGELHAHRQRRSDLNENRWSWQALDKLRWVAAFWIEPVETH